MVLQQQYHLDSEVVGNEFVTFVMNSESSKKPLHNILILRTGTASDETSVAAKHTAARFWLVGASQLLLFRWWGG